MNDWAKRRARLMLTKFLRASVIAGIAMSVIGCATNPDVVFVSALPDSTDLVRLGRDVRGHIFFRRDGKWIRSENKVLLPAGWYAGGIPRETSDEDGDPSRED